MTAKSPAFQFYPDDFLGSGKVGTMTAEEVGAYTLLLCLDWNEIGFVFDEEELSRWCRMSRAQFRKAWRRISRCFVEREGRMFNPRLELERAKQAEWREKSRQGGLKSGRSRAKGGSTVVQPPDEPNTQPNTNTPSPSPKTKRSKASAPRGAEQIGGSWPTRLALVWTEEVGAITPGRIGAALKPAVDKHGEEKTERAMRAFISIQKASRSPCEFAWFAKQYEVWIERTKSPVAVIDGEMSDTLELLTRPRAS